MSAVNSTDVAHIFLFAPLKENLPAQVDNKTRDACLNV